MCFRAVWRWATLDSKLRGWNEKKILQENTQTKYNPNKKAAKLYNAADALHVNFPQI